MSQDEKPSGKFPASGSASADEEGQAPDAPKSSHKVIADIHSGMVMVAPVATTIEDDDEEEALSEEPAERGDEEDQN